MKICIGQINTTPGDFEGNLERITRGMEIAATARCDAIVFPELAIPGYLSQDLMYSPEFIDRNGSVLREVTLKAGKYPDLTVVVGCIERNPGSGKPFFNSAAVIQQGRVAAMYAKQLIPFYDVFDELRYFEPGSELAVVEIAGRKVGIAICEDLWNDKGADDYRYADNPMSRYREQGVDTIFSLNSSPYVHGKCEQRLRRIAPGTVEGGTVVYVNQCGGQDELVFDGQSFVVRDGGLLHLSNVLFRDSYEIVDIDDPAVIVEDVESPDAQATITSLSVDLYDLIVLAVKDYVQKSGFSDLVLASSGGVDSAVVCKIACDAVGPRHVHAIRMPSIFSSAHSREDAKALHRNLGCWDYEVEIEHESIVDYLNTRFSRYQDADNLVRSRLDDGRYSPVADENIQARLRDLYVMHFSNAFGAMPLSTGNKTEAACGYYTHFDMNFSFAPIKDLYKHEVMALARMHGEIPENIWRKAPSAELAHDQRDEDSLLPYAILDVIAHAYVEDYISTFEGFKGWLDRKLGEGARISGDVRQLEEWVRGGGAAADFGRITSLIGRMEYKRRQTCPGVKVSKVAFGIGRRIPIVEKWLRR